MNYPTGTYKFPTKRQNRTYKGKLTKMRQTKQNKEILVAMVFVISFTLIQMFSNTTNDIKIDDTMASAEVIAIAESEAGDVAIKANTSPAELPPYETLSFVSKMNPVESEIREIAREHNFQWTDYLIRLAMCESSLNPNATNDNGIYGVDRGIFQINSRYHWEVSDECAFDIKCATEWTINRVNDGYQKEWVCNSKI